MWDGDGHRWQMGMGRFCGVEGQDSAPAGSTQHLRAGQAGSGASASITASSVRPQAPSRATAGRPGWRQVANRRRRRAAGRHLPARMRRSTTMTSSSAGHVPGALDVAKGSVGGVIVICTTRLCRACCNRRRHLDATAAKRLPSDPASVHLRNMLWQFCRKRVVGHGGASFRSP